MSMYEELKIPAIGIDGFGDRLAALALESGYSIGVIQLKHLIIPTAGFPQKFNTEYALSSTGSRYFVTFKTRNGMPPENDGDYDPEYNQISISREDRTVSNNSRLIACFEQIENWQLMPNISRCPIDDTLGLPADIISYSERPVSSESRLQIWEADDPFLFPLIQTLRSLAS